MSQTSLPSPPDSSSTTEHSGNTAHKHKGAFTGADFSPGLSYVGAPANQVAQNSQAGTNTVQAGPPYYYPTGQASSSHQYACYPVHAAAWSNPWSLPYAGGTSNSAPYYLYSHAQVLNQPNTHHSASSPTGLATGVSQQELPFVSPSPSPLLQVHGHWDSVIKEFLSAAGLAQALRGFEADVIVMGPDWERNRIPLALEGLMKNLLVCISDSCLDAKQ